MCVSAIARLAGCGGGARIHYVKTTGVGNVLAMKRRALRPFPPAGGAPRPAIRSVVVDGRREQRHLGVFTPTSAPVSDQEDSGPARGPPEAPCAEPQCGNGAPAQLVSVITDFPIKYG